MKFLKMNLKILNYNMYIIKIKNKIYHIQNYIKNFSLLKILTLNSINISYQCCEGYCGTCKIKLLHGKIKYFNKNILAVKKPGYIFPCCCIIKSDIEIMM